MEWFKTWFNTPYYHILYQDRNYEEAEGFLHNLIEKLDLKSGSRIIDLACGKGRHSVFLNKLGYSVLGLDLSEESILNNKKFENENLRFKVQDMRNPILGEKADAVLNLFTSFGYFENDSDDQNVFNSVSNTLEKNGVFVLDFMNSEFVKNHFVAEEKIVKNDITFCINKSIVNQHIIKTISFRDKNEDFKFIEKVKLLNLKDIEGFAKNTGLKKVEIWGDYKLNAFDENLSPRCIVLFKKSL